MARRQKNSSIGDDLLSLSANFPFWVCIILAALTYAVLHMYAGEEAGDLQSPKNIEELGAYAGQALLRSVAAFGQYIFPSIILVGGLAGILKRSLKKGKYNRISKSADPGASIRQLTWHDFEVMTGEALRRQGYQVAETKKGPDGGVDLILHKKGELFLVQCKQWRSVRVGVKVVRELYGVMTARGAVGGFVVTSGGFTAEAERFAKGTNVALVDGAELVRWFSSIAKN
ncbi:restriction endonuclease [Pseudomonas sp. RP23018S]|uniref:restriction endonuclease n=1 Tax=Pseudomonas sp. RP23018S TaxID=3096037 RepID=UPI002ACAA052|nr:restriction endonuclease [Pseudomonas sp. RP23018S]MDZ5605183.1 restriction endonuclease [Pseudomonas sp. RP23018S]